MEPKIIESRRINFPNLIELVNDSFILSLLLEGGDNFMSLNLVFPTITALGQTTTVRILPTNKHVTLIIF